MPCRALVQLHFLPLFSPSYLFSSPSPHLFSFVILSPSLLPIYLPLPSPTKLSSPSLPLPLLLSLFIYIRPRSALWMPPSPFSTILLRYLPLSLSLSLYSLFSIIYIIYIIPSRATVIGIVSLYEFYSLCGMPNGNPTGKEP